MSIWLWLAQVVFTGTIITLHFFRNYFASITALYYWSNTSTAFLSQRPDKSNRLKIRMIRKCSFVLFRLIQMEDNQWSEWGFSKLEVKFIYLSCRCIAIENLSLDGNYSAWPKDTITRIVLELGLFRYLINSFKRFCPHLVSDHLTIKFIRIVSINILYYYIV